MGALVYYYLLFISSRRRRRRVEVQSTFFPLARCPPLPSFLKLEKFFGTNLNSMTAVAADGDGVCHGITETTHF